MGCCMAILPEHRATAARSGLGGECAPAWRGGDARWAGDPRADGGGVRGPDA